MATYTFELPSDITYQDLEKFSNSNNANIGEILKDYIRQLLGKNNHSLSSNGTDIAQTPLLTEKQQQDLLAIRALSGKYRKFAKNQGPFSVEDMNRIVQEEFAKEWIANDRLNRSDAP
ncbi:MULTISPECIES: hypothetical protein [unclassified Moraxella]|uniref:hypothetical protein n=1 Tax=unclassified Moraxella TaxID=2685852 RepID=UPI003AF6276E